ncbi:MAG: response regulator [Planctomycetes bacterium]|nr:response regulator [Planctomycetota bacterium]
MAERILIVEDSRPIREVTTEFLRDEGYEVDAAATGTEGIELLEKNEYDLILTDLRLPGADGFAIVEAGNASQPLTPKIIMTAYSEVEDALRALRLGAYDFLQKPIRNMWELTALAERAITHKRLLLERDNHQKEIEKLNASLEEEVKRRTEELVRANRELRTLDEMKNNLLANVSHELRTPLVSVRGYTELFFSGRLCPIPDDCLKYLETSLRNVDKLLSLIDSLVGYAELAREGVALSLEVVDLCDSMGRIADSFKRVAQEAKVELILNLPEDRVLVNADRSRLEEAVKCIVDNAIKFTPENGEASINVDMVGKKLAKINIRDTGDGIPGEEQARIFERFYQIDGSPTRAHGGTGMGLAIARDNLRLIGCELRVSSEPSKGSNFYFTIPSIQNGSES